jgi:hypothetical protein
VTALYGSTSIEHFWAWTTRKVPEPEKDILLWSADRPFLIVSSG